MLRISTSGIFNQPSQRWISYYHDNTKIENLNTLALCQSKHVRQSSSTELSKRKFKRCRYSSDINRSIARNIHEWNPQIAPTFDQPQIQDAIADHAYRRIQIFYYQCLAYYYLDCEITQGRTEIQHGTSNHPWSSAAHSSLLTHLHDNYFEILKQKLYEDGISDRIEKILKALGVDDEKIKANSRRKLELHHIEFLLEEIDVEKGLIDPNSTLYASMNATVELPQEVNQYDCVIEKQMRGKALALLNRVSREGLHPYRATELLVAEMGSFFQKSLDETREKMNLIREIESLEQNQWFAECNLTRGNVDDYMDINRQLKARYERMHEINEFSMHRKNGFSLGWRLDLLKMKKPSHKKIIREVKKKSELTFPPQTREQFIKILENSIEIIGMQWNNTRAPPYKSLSGRFTDNELKDCAEKDLFEEQLIIIKRD